LKEAGAKHQKQLADAEGAMEKVSRINRDQLTPLGQGKISNIVRGFAAIAATAADATS
jgi:hypothetical protein